MASSSLYVPPFPYSRFSQVADNLVDREGDGSGSRLSHYRS